MGLSLGIKLLEGIIFILSLYLHSISEQYPSLQFPRAPRKPGCSIYFSIASRKTVGQRTHIEMLLDFLALAARSSCAPGPHRTVTTRETFLAGNHPHSTTQTAYRNTFLVFP